MTPERTLACASTLHNCYRWASLEQRALAEGAWLDVPEAAAYDAFEALDDFADAVQSVQAALQGEQWDDVRHLADELEELAEALPLPEARMAGLRPVLAWLQAACEGCGANERCTPAVGNVPECVQQAQQAVQLAEAREDVVQLAEAVVARAVELLAQAADADAEHLADMQHWLQSALENLNTALGD